MGSSKGGGRWLRPHSDLMPGPTGTQRNVNIYRAGQNRTFNAHIVATVQDNIKRISPKVLETLRELYF